MKNYRETKNYYVSIEEAKKEIWKRWHDKNLRKKVENFLGNDIIKIFNGKPRVVLCQYITVPANDTMNFLDSSKKIGLNPLFLEYSDDKLVAKNLGKYLLGKMFFCDDKNIKSLNNISRLMAINFNIYEGKKFNEIKTFWNEPLISFHHNILKRIVLNINYEIHDFSEWFQKTRHLTEYYYLYHLDKIVNLHCAK